MFNPFWKADLKARSELASFELKTRREIDKKYLEKYGKTFQQWCQDYFWERYNKQWHKELVVKKFIS